jgi:hypothetical protein
MRNSNLAFFLGFGCCSLAIALVLLYTSIVKGERASGRGIEKGPKVAIVRVVNFLIAQAGSQDQKPDRPPQRGKGRKD